MNIVQYLARRQFSTPGSSLPFPSSRHSQVDPFEDRPSSSDACPWAFYYKSLVCYPEDEHYTENRDYGTPIPPFGCSFCANPGDCHILAVADEDGFVQLVNSNKSGPSALVKEWRAHANAVFDLSWAANEAKLLTGSGDQTAILWDTISGRSIRHFHGHQSSVKSVNFRRNDSNVFVSGSRDGSIKVWDVRCSEKMGRTSSALTIPDAHVTYPQSRSYVKPVKRIHKRRRVSTGDQSKSVTSTLFLQENTIVSSGASNSVIKFWDIRKCRRDTKPVRTFQYSGQSVIRQHGYSHLALDSAGGRLFANCTDDTIYMYDCISQNEFPMAAFYGHLTSSFYVRMAVSPDNKFLLSGSSDSNAYMWQIDSPDTPPFVLTGHSKEVTSVAWCGKDVTRLATCSDDNTVRIWRLDRQADKSQRNVLGRTRVAEKKPVSEVIKSPSPIPRDVRESRQPSILSFIKTSKSLTNSKSSVEDDKENVEPQSFESGYWSTEDTPPKRPKSSERTLEGPMKEAKTNLTLQKQRNTIKHYFSPK
eukprot:m.216254 g.216254  ORF g.216254 m.216254 type:complete len:531 (+) comp39855_c1_seq7:55-1647(+)